MFTITIVFSITTWLTKLLNIKSICNTNATCLELRTIELDEHKIFAINKANMTTKYFR